MIEMKYTLLFPLKSFIICQQKKRIYTKTEEGKKKKRVLLWFGG